MKYSSLATPLKMVCAVLLCATVSSCLSDRVVYVKDDEPVRLRETVKGVKVWAVDKAGKEIPATKDLQEGSFNLTDPGPGK